MYGIWCKIFINYKHSCNINLETFCEYMDFHIFFVMEIIVKHFGMFSLCNKIDAFVFQGLTTHTHTYTHTYMHTYIRTHIQTHTIVL